MTRSSQFMEYMKLHLISLEQDLEVEESEYDVTYLEGCIHTVQHLLSVATDIMNSSNERYNND